VLFDAKRSDHSGKRRQHREKVFIIFSIFLAFIIPAAALAQGAQEDFDSFTLGANVGSHADWFDGGGGPVVQAGTGVAGSNGLDPAGSIFTWNAHPFDWNDPDFRQLIVSMDFQTDGAGNFDDDRVGWMITNSSAHSDNIFGIQLDPGGGGQNIEAYWDGASADGGRTSIVTLPPLPGNTFYRLRAEITKLTATSAKIDVSLTELDTFGDPGAVVASGSILNTDLLPDTAGDQIPNTKYFTAATIWPAFKNHSAAGGAADNAFAEVVTGDFVRIAVFGDFGSGGSNEGAVADLVDILSPDLIVTTGDNNYSNNSAISAWDNRVGQFYGQYISYPAGSSSAYAPGPATNMFFPALGNHDWDAGGQETYFDLPGNERYYDTVQGPAHIFVVDSDGREPDGTGSGSTQGVWLQSQLEASTAPWQLVFMHHPPYSSSSSHGSSAWMQWPYEDWGAEAVFSGHDHVYERIHRDDNTDGTEIAYLTTGAGGMSLYGFGTPVAGSEVRYDANYGTMLVEVSPTRINYEFWSIADGGTLIDTYTMENPSAASTVIGACEDFESGFAGANVGAHADWFDAGGGPVATAGNGVASSVGLAQDNTIFTWTAHPFDWNAPDFQSVAFEMDFQTSDTGQFDDDRVGWMITDSSTHSNNIFGVQLDPGGGGQNIEAYWDGNTFGDDGGRTSIVTLPALSNDTFYRLWAKFTKLTATSARVDVSLTELDGAGNPGLVVATGSIPDTDLLPNTAGEEIPNPGYFTGPIWPAFKNHQGPVGAVDNACYETVSGATAPTAPAAPTGLAATDVSSSRIDLSWTDNADNESGFEVESSEAGGPFGLIDTLGVDVTSYEDTGLASSTAYCYRVRAINAGGSSDYTSEQCATTPAPPAGAPDWIAYNDLDPRVPSGSTDNAPNVTEFDYTVTGGTLVDYTSGAVLPVTMSGSFNSGSLSKRGQRQRR
jgi:hypothetical protein